MFKSKKLLALLLLLFVIVLLGVDTVFNYFSGKFDYLRGIVTETLGIILTVYFVELVLQENSKHKEKELKLAKIRCINSIISIYVRNMVIRINQMIVGIRERNNKQYTPDELFIDKNFSFNRLANIFDPSFSNLDKFYDPSFRQYFKAEKELQNAVEKFC